MEYWEKRQQQLRNLESEQIHQVHHVPIHQHNKENQQDIPHLTTFLSEKTELTFQLKCWLTFSDDLIHFSFSASSTAWTPVSADDFNH